MTSYLHALKDRRGTSLVEMLLVLTLGGLITAAAVSMIAPTNRVAREATESSEVEEGARSSINLLAASIRRVPLGGVQVATRDSLVVAMPVAVGAFCANDGNRLSIYFGLGGRSLNVAAVDGFAIRDSAGAWYYTAYPGTSIFYNTTAGRSACIAAGGGVAGSNSDYYTFYTSADVPLGTGFMVYDRQTFKFGRSALDPATRGFFYGSTGSPLLEVAFELHANTRFEYRLRNNPAWYPAITSGHVHNIDAIRVIVGGVYDTAGLIAREIPLINSE